jgi:hypothetical protein
LLKHENTTSEDLSILSELNKLSKKRKKEEVELKEKNDREWDGLSNKKEIVQLKFFLNKFGPLEGKREYRFSF